MFPFPTPRNLPEPGIEPESLVSPALEGGFFFFYHYATWEARLRYYLDKYYAKIRNNKYINFFFF